MGVCMSTRGDVCWRYFENKTAVDLGMEINYRLRYVWG